MNDAPIFIKLNEYKEILKLVEVINKKLEAIDKSLQDVNVIKDKEDVQMATWREQLERVSGKMVYINDALKEM